MDYNLKNKVVLITGANSGIGKAASLQLARCGATLVMACRSLERGTRAFDEVRARSTNAQVHLIQVDMSSQDSIREFARKFQDQFQHLHVLIHNAANFDQTQKKPVLTPDGVETVFATNHLGPFLLTHLLLKQLKTSAPSRIITVASKGLISYPRLDIEFDNLNGQRKYNLQHAYYHSKQAQVMFSFDLAERLRGTGVTVHCIRVGNVAIPDERLTHLPRWMHRMYELKRRFAMTPEKMAETYLWLAADPVGESQRGGYWDAPGVRVEANKHAYNLETQRRLWDISCQLTGVSVDGEESWDSVFHGSS
jgi:NAD(P)-dependent dehydrogenase (short-subunit alcohol dehydrogenase family)